MNEFGFVYLWFDVGRKRYYLGSHWGTPDDGYVCSSPWMLRARERRPEDFVYSSGKPRRKILAKVYTNREDLIDLEDRWLKLIKESEIKPSNETPRYYNLSRNAWKLWHTLEESKRSVGERISIAKKGKKTGPRDPSVGKAISEAKRKKFEERRAASLPCYDVNVWENNPNMARVQTEEINSRRSESLKAAYAEDRKKPRSGPISTEHREAISKKLKGRKNGPMSDETKAKLAKTYRVTSPSGEEVIVTNLKRFCSENGLQNTNITKSSGSRGWKATRL